MRKTLAFLVLLLLPWVARGQALADWYYWFDTEDTPHETGTVTNQQFQLSADVSCLGWGLHTLYVQVKDTAGLYSVPHGQVFYNMPANGTNNLKFCYCFDGSTDVYEQPYSQGIYMIDVAKLTPGFHVINYFVLDNDGSITGRNSAGFYRSPVSSNQKLHYWFDGDSVTTLVPDYKDGFIVDVSDVKEGFNTIFFQMEDNGPTEVLSSHFIKIPQTENAGNMTLVCIIDGQIVSEEKVAANGGMVKCDMDVANIEVGIHKAMFQLITASGVGSTIAETYFVRTLTNDDIASMQCLYTIDGFNQHVEKGTCTNGVFHFDLPVDDMENGLHRIDFMLVAENGATTTQGSAWFFKTPLGGNAITQYDYWLNGKNDDVHSVKLDEPTDPFQLVKLLPVTAEPIRSACFHFEVKDGQPKIYAKNDIHFRFHDRSGRWVDADNQYVDYNVGEDVNVTKQLTEVYGKETFAVPDSNAIQWYTMECAAGDSIAVQSSQATSIQAFSPSDTEVFNVSGSESVKLTGFHAREDGTYYLAVHDVTGSKPELTLNYQHIDKYAILDYDVLTVGNGGCSTITFNGNGFDDLYAVELYNTEGDTIPSIDIGHESNATTSVTFDFAGVELGKYNALFHFTLEDRTVNNALQVEEAKDIDLVTKVSYPSTFLRGTSVTYTVEITNKGNMTAYGVPIYTYIKNKSRNGISWIEYDVLKTGKMLTIDGLDYNDSKSIHEQIRNINKDVYFAKLYTSDPESNDSALIRTNYSFVTIPPYSSLVYDLEITSSDEVEVWVTVSKDWISFSTDSVCYSQHRRLKNYASAKDYYCCYKEHIECFLEQATAALDVTSLALAVSGVLTIAQPEIALALESGAVLTGLTGCLGSLTNDELKHFGTTLCESDKKGLENFLNAAKASVNAPISIPSVVSCLGATLSALGFGVKAIFKASECVVGELGTQLGAAATGLDFVNDDTSCKKLKEKKPNCPPNPGGGGGTSTPRNSCEPNDIRGYTAESGSMFMKDDVDEVTYIIDSENDPVFADAAAHTVIITDTINGKYYDLTSLSTRNITIGDVSMDLDGKEQNFIKTMDLRPRLNVIAQVEQKYDPNTGIAKWIWTSLDPMSMEPTDDVMQGVLPVNDESRNGEGHITYRLKQKTGLPDGMEVTNQADIIFDSNEPVFTPVWTNIVDAVAPTSMVSDLIVRNDSICDLSFEGEDNRSGIWKYTLYVQDGLSAPWREVATDIAPDSIYSFKGFDCINYGFCVLATDSAGNVERKELTAEVVKMSMRLGDVNADGDINVIDFTAIANHIMGSTPASFVVKAADVNEDDEINVMDLTGVANLILFGEVSPNRAQANSRMRRVSDQLTLHVSDCEVMAGEEFTVDIHMDGDADFSAFQFDMALPEGIHVKMVDGAPCATLSTERTNTADTDFFVSRLSDDGTLRVFCASTRDALIEGKEGCVAHVTLVADEKAPAGDYEVAVSHIVAAYGGTGENLSPANFVATVGGSTDMNSLIDGTHGSSLYDMVGKKIRRDHERISLEKGAYIKNGQKVIVK